MDDFKILMMNSFSNVYIEENMDENVVLEMFLIMRMKRLEKFQMVVEFELIDMYYYFFVRMLVCIIGSFGVIIVFFIYCDGGLLVKV